MLCYGGWQEQDIDLQAFYYRGALNMNLEKVIFAFFIVLALTLNFGFFIGDLDDPSHHNIYELFAALVVSHGISFVANFLLGGERDELRLRQIMGSPYGRIVVLHIAVIFGAVAVTALGQPIAMLVVLTLLKVAVDVKLHLREHYRAAPD